jgi:hypothetical protein
MNTTLFESGATSHAVNDLILFTDNTRELAELRDSIYEYWSSPLVNAESINPERFLKLSGAAKLAYRKEFNNIEDNAHVRNMTKEQTREFCELYANDFKNWKQEHGF